MERNERNMPNQTIITGMFKDRKNAELAYEGLKDRGYEDDEINVIMSDSTRKIHFGDDRKDSGLGNKSLEGAGKGSAIGGSIGAIAGVVAALGTNLLIPGLGLVVAGPLAAGLAGAGAGGITGGLIGALVGSGIPEDRAKEFEEGVKNGHIIVSAKAKSEKDADFFKGNWESKDVDEDNNVRGLRTNDEDIRKDNDRDNYSR